jgi:hypothetical protein
MLSAAANGQSWYFNEPYDFFNQADAGITCLAHDTVYYFSGGARSTGPWNNFIGQCDVAGSLLDHHTLGMQGYDRVGRELILFNGSLYLTTQDKELTVNRYQVGLVKYDQKLDTIWSRQYGVLTHQEISQSVIATSDGNLAIAGAIDSDDSLGFEMLLLKVDTLGSVLWQRSYGWPIQFGNYNTDYAWDVTQTNDRGFILSGYRDPPLSHRRFLVVRTDSMGNQLWEKTYGGPFDDWGGSVSNSMEGGFLIGGYKALDINNDSGRAWLVKVDDLGGVEWNKTYTVPNMVKGEVEGIIQLSDSSYVILGNNRPWYYRGWIFKVSSNGDLIWSRMYTRNSGHEHNYFWDFSETPDDGFLVCGTTHGITQDAWLLKLDSLGCNAPGCDTINGVINVTYPVDELRVSPNPTAGLVSMHLPDNVRQVGLRVHVIDIMGRNVLTAETLLNTELNLTALPAGMYSIIVESDRILSCKVVRR